MYFLYRILSYPAIPLAILRILYKSIKLPEYRQRIPERLGIVDIPQNLNPIWIHGVSVGEANVALLLVKGIRKQFPDIPVLITTTTPTGSQLIKQNLTQNIHHCYLPYDCPICINRFIRHINPICFIVMETEIWPNLFFHLNKEGVPIIIANGRISPSSFKNYLKIKKIMATVLNKCTFILTQDKEYQKRFLMLGAKEEKVIPTGNIKFDIPISKIQLSKGKEIKSQYLSQYNTLIGASTHEGEEKVLLDIYSTLLKKIKNLKLILVPRHPERFSSVYRLCISYNLKVHKRSENLVPEKDFDIYLGDSMGEMMMYYAMSDIAFVGGSIAKIGGHNILEPTSIGIPVVIGPHYFNFYEITEILKKKNAIYISKNKEELKDHLLELFTNKELRENISKKAMEVTYQNRGALDRTLEIIFPIIQNQRQKFS